MDLFLILLLLLAVGGVVVVALGKVGGGLAPATPDVVPPLDERVSRPADLDRARFSLALRGYRMDQVDGVLDEARDLLVARDEEIARLRRLVPVGAAAAGRPDDEVDATEAQATEADPVSGSVPATGADPDIRPVATGDAGATATDDTHTSATVTPSPSEPADDPAARSDVARDPAP